MSNEELISILEKRFIKNEKMHKGINWDEQEATRPIATGFMLSSS